MTTRTRQSAAAAVDAADQNPFVQRVQRWADEVLKPTALLSEVHGVHAERIDALRRVGLLTHLAPSEYGGDGIDRAADRRLHEVISGACFNTWLVWAQHGPLGSRIAQAKAAGRPVSPLAGRALRGEILLGAGISDVRRHPHRFIAATRTDDGWTFSGTVSWASGWGLNSALTIAAVAPGDEPGREEVVTALVQVGPDTVGTPLDLSAVEGSRTARVHLRDVYVPDEDVLQVQSLDAWRRGDIGIASDARPHHFGLAQRVLAELDVADHPLARRVAQVWRPRVAEIRERAYALADEASAAGGGPHRLDERLATKVASGEALSTLTKALLVARSGRGLAGTDTAQLHARSALFILVQGQSDDVRAAQLDELAR